MEATEKESNEKETLESTGLPLTAFDLYKRDQDASLEDLFS